eukprot:TRINITY_DN63295_c0_g1_i1.p1 TRINITY_DN63295_c0_g1~~TRINITY_DN63295_c0_g1_i1.p1  ORF type:complete len:261 (+),score=36.66 TRINITY_DN63295_c0_g1_i1:48-830(+)
MADAFGDIFPNTTLPELCDDIVISCTAKLEKLSKNVDHEKVMRYEMLGLPLPDIDIKANCFEARGIAHFRLGESSVNPKSHNVSALEDLRTAKTLLAKSREPRPLNKEATQILATLEAGEYAIEVASGHSSADAPANHVTPDDELDKKAATTVSKQALQLGRSEASVGKEDDIADGEPVKSASAGIVADLRIDVQKRGEVTTVTATPAEGVEVDAKEGMVRFRKSGVTWDVPVDGMATLVKRRGTCLVVTCQEEQTSRKA